MRKCLTTGFQGGVSSAQDPSSDDSPACVNFTKLSHTGQNLRLLVGSASHFHFTFPVICWPVPCLKECQVHIFSKRTQLTQHGTDWMKPELHQGYMAKVSNCLNFPRRPFHTDMAEHFSQINLTASISGIRTFLIKRCCYFLMQRPTVLSNIRIRTKTQNEKL